MHLLLTLIFAVAAIANFCWIVIFFWNLAYLRSTSRGLAPPAQWPGVDILVPARDEERNIERCVRGLCMQEYPGDWHITVCDDESGDHTLEILRGLERDFPGRLTVIEGKSEPLPAGWVGKVWATTRLGKQAKRDWLMFFDADTFHGPQMLREVMLRALKPIGMGEKPLGLIGGCPNLEQLSAGEKTFMPVIQLMYLMGPTALNRNSKTMPTVPGFFQLFPRAAYEQVGGYAKVWDRVLDDVCMARLINRSGFQTRVIDPSPWMGLRMYRSAREIWFGLHKSTGYIMYRSVTLSSLFMLWVLVTGVLPFFAPLLWLLHANASECVLATAAMVQILALRAVMWRIQGGAWWSGLLHPVLFLFLGVNCLVSTVDIRVGRGVLWKGRWYDRRMKPEAENRTNNSNNLPAKSGLVSPVESKT